MRKAVLALWHDAELRTRIGQAGRKHAETYLSDEAAGRHLSEVLDEVLT